MHDPRWGRCYRGLLRGAGQISVRRFPGTVSTCRKQQRICSPRSFGRRAVQGRRSESAHTACLFHQSRRDPGLQVGLRQHHIWSLGERLDNRQADLAHRDDPHGQRRIFNPGHRSGQVLLCHRCAGDRLKRIRPRKAWGHRAADQVGGNRGDPPGRCRP